MKKSQTIFVVLFILIAITACSNISKDYTPEDIPLTSISIEPFTTQSIITATGTTYPNPNGNKYVSGSINLPTITPIDIPLAGKPNWVVGVEINEGSLWLVTLDNGHTQTFKVDKQDNIIELSTAPNQLAIGMPPILIISNNSPMIANLFNPDFSISSHPIVFNHPDQYAGILNTGELIIQKGAEYNILDVNALLDTRIAKDSDNNLLFLSDPTTAYDHGVLGDGIEAQTITKVNTETLDIQLINIPKGYVIEGIMPIWTDITGNGMNEIIVTLSAFGEGAKLTILSNNGDIIASSDPIGQSYRWRHQLVVAPFGPNGEMELVDVLTPHLGKIIEFFQIKGDKLVRVAIVEGYTSHQIGSRNLDMAVAGDFDNDKKIELLIPNSNFSSLGGIGRTTDGARVKWNIEIGSRLSTNISTIQFDNGSIAVAVGRKDNVLRLWLPTSKN